MYVFYLDDSRDNTTQSFSALGIPVSEWKASFRLIADFRKTLLSNHRIPLRSELHATEFIRGQGSAGQAVKSKAGRVKIFHDTLDLVAHLPGARLINACDKKRYAMTLFERMVNRINTCAMRAGTWAMLISDEGKEKAYRLLFRQLARVNYIPSQFGAWGGGARQKNIPTERIIEDIAFRESHQSHFLQMADLCAWSLLRMESPLESKSELGLDGSFLRLKPILVTQAFSKDPRGLGIIRG